MIRWDDDHTDVVLNPRLGATDLADVRRLIAACPNLPAHIWLTTSGATGRLKPVALAKQALLAAADAVNQHLETQADDVWCRPLPLFHAGGLSIHARAFRSGSQVFALEKWDVFTFHNMLADEAVTLTSLVPTQLRDLIHHRLTPPPFLRAALLGGGATPPDLWSDARALAWPILPTYGTTETAAAVAIAAVDDLSSSAPPRLRVLPHVEARATDDGRLAFRTAALLTGYATESGLHDPKQYGWWTSDDLGAVADGGLTVHGRADDVVKIGGESVAVAALQERLDSLARTTGVADAVLVAVPDERLGAVLLLAVVGSRGDAETLRARYDEAVLPFERVRELVVVKEIARTALGKVRREELLRATGRI
ncbi:MAG: AMP-binding protein [Gemmatimonadales bacterium]